MGVCLCRLGSDRDQFLDKVSEAEEAAVTRSFALKGLISVGVGKICREPVEFRLVATDAVDFAAEIDAFQVLGVSLLIFSE